MELFNRFIYQLTMYQKDLTSEITSALRADLTLESILFVLGISFFYGIVHAIGPGHGKAVVASYFLSKNSSIKSAIHMGFFIAIFHALSALVATYGIYFFIKGFFSKNFDTFYGYIYQFSGVLIILIGLYLLYEAYSHKKCCSTEKDVENGNFYQTAIAIGIVPCPGAMTIIIFTLLLKKIYIGILAALAMSIGMGITISLIGILSTYSRSKIGNFEKAIFYLNFIAPIFMILLGLFIIQIV
ncbi:MAG: hypothetical protein OIF32_04230 [Campylobacterales bacterium]|nr:hypothetical protein [Campylobacterales bacterium]